MISAKDISEASKAYETISGFRSRIKALSDQCAVMSSARIDIKRINRGYTERVCEFDIVDAEEVQMLKAIFDRRIAGYRGRLREIGRRLAQLSCEVPEDCR